MFAEIEQLKLENLHNFYNCKDKSCREFSEGEKARPKLLKKTRMHHKWLKGKDLVYCKTVLYCTERCFYSLLHAGTCEDYSL